MDLLPTELIQQICKYLCFHCQHPGIFPNADSRVVRDRKCSLSRLCGTSRRIRVIAQPVLYHYYATGNLPPETGSCLQHTTRAASEDDKLPLFLRTLVHRPDLAVHVRALQLVDSDVVKGCSDDLILALGVKARQSGIRAPDTDAVVPRRELALNDRLSSLECHRWLEELAIALAPGLEMLLVAHTASSRFLSKARVVNSRLKTLALRGYSGQYYFSEASSVIAAAPNLHTLYLLDCSHFTGWSHVFGSTLELVLANLRRMVINGIRAEHLENILRNCSQLQDLEYYQQTAAGIWNVSHVVQSLMPVKSTLRRLYFACLPIATYDFNRARLQNGGHTSEERLQNYVEDALTVSYDTSAIELLHKFEHLEELGIDQASIYSPSSLDPEINPGRLSRLLPPRIRTIRVMYVYRDMMSDLYSLGSQARDNFPKLRHLSLGQAVPLMPRRRPGVRQMKQVKSIATATGESIAVSWTFDKPGVNARARIPGGTIDQRRFYVR